MASSKNERAVYLVSATIVMTPEDAPLSEFDETLKTLNSLYSQGRAFAALNDSDGVCEETVGLSAEDAAKTNHDLSDVLYIADMQIGEDQTVILVTRGDNSIASPAFVHRKDRAVRIAKPRKDEAPGHSCHLVISHDADVKTKAHRVTIEKVPSVSRTLVTRFLNALLRCEAKRSGTCFERKTGKEGPRKIKCYPRIEFAHHPSHSLENDVASGRVTSITLISRDETFSGPDAGVRIKRAKRDMSLSVDYGRDPKELMKWLKSWVPKYAREEKYDEVQIHIAGLNGGRSAASPTFELDQIESAQTVYARTAILTDFEKPLEQCESLCNDEIAAKMNDVISNDSNWR